MIGLSLVGSGAFTAIPARAADSSYVLLAPLPCIQSPAAKDADGKVIPNSEVNCGGNGTMQTTIDFKTYVQYAFNLFIALAAVAAVFMIVWGGFEYMTTDAWSQKKAGREKVTNAVVGLLLVLSSYLILRTINPQFVNIPASLVTPLKLPCPTDITINSDDSRCKSATVSYFDQIANEADNYKTQQASIVADVNKTKATVTALQNQYDDLEAKRIEAGTIGDTAAEAQYAKEEENIYNQIVDAKANLAVQEAQKIMAGALNTESTTGDLGSNNKELETSVQNAYQQALTRLSALGNPPDKIQDLVNSYNSTYGQLLLTDAVLQRAPADQILVIQSDIQGALISQMTDSPQKTDLQDHIKTTMTLLCKTVGENPYLKAYSVCKAGGYPLY